MADHAPTRRQVISGGLALGALALAGCAPSRTRVSGPPSPVWPTSRRLTSGVYPPPEGATRPIEMPAPTGAPRVMPRSAWTGTQPTLALANRMGRVERITIHHDAMDAAGFRSAGEARQRLADIQRAHVGNGWADIGYHYVIDPTGTIWAARPVQLQGAHVRDWNEHNLGIMMMGNFMHERPTSAALASLQSLVRSESARYRVPAARISTHRELATTACPGDSLQQQIDIARNRRIAGFA
ncbi:MAG: peptidoglycan recognition family protein [Phycisphaerales bacterium]